MAKSTFTGPLMSLGGLAGGVGGSTPREYSDEIGPSIFWGGMAIPATGSVSSKDQFGAGSIAAVFGAFPIRTLNATPAPGVGLLTVAAFAIAGVPQPNIVAYALGRAPGTPAVISGIAYLNGVGLDMGLDAAVFATTGIATLAVPANAWRYRAGQWIGLLNGGPGGATQMSQITAINALTGVLTLSPAPAVNSTGQIALTNRFNPNAYGASGPPSSLAKLASSGSARILIPEIGSARGVGVTGIVGSSGGSVLIQGIDVFGSPQSEMIVRPAGIGTTWGRKTYSIFVSATPQFSDNTNYSVVTSDLIGLPLSVLSADSLVDVAFGGTPAVAGDFTIVPADLTNPATTTTGDPRGAIQVSANGPAAAPATPLVLDGATVLTVDQRLNPLQVALATATNPGALLGVAPA
jgi:hypothetical protein